MKHLLLLAVVLAMATTAFASPCMFTSAPVGPCTEGDKDFSVFTINPGLPAGTTVSIAQSGPNVYEVKFNNDAGIKNAFNFTYTVTLNGLCPTCFISEVDAGITGGVNPALLETHVTPLVPAGAPQTGNTTQVGGTLQFTGLNATSVEIFNHYTGNTVHYATTITNTIIQNTPEPLTVGLTGLGLAVFGLVARRKFAR